MLSCKRVSAVAGGFWTGSSWRLARDAVKDTVFAVHSGGTSDDHHSTAVVQKFSLADVIVLSTCMWLDTVVAEVAQNRKYR